MTLHTATSDKSIGIVSMETAKNHCDFFILNGLQLSNDYDIQFFGIQTTVYMYRHEYHRYLWTALSGKTYS